MRAMDDELIITIVLDKTVLNELAHEVGCHLASRMILSELGQFLLELEDLHLLVLCILFLLLSSFLVSLDLSLCSSSLARDLEHVGGHALGR